MKPLTATIANATLFMAVLASAAAFSQSTRQPGSRGRAEYIEVEPNVKLHVTDLGEGKPVVLIHGWPLSDAMYEYQYAALVENGYRVIGITLEALGFQISRVGTTPMMFLQMTLK
jgi:pimeloyl-ACP methyl ester carboxylesterase